MSPPARLLACDDDDEWPRVSDGGGRRRGPGGVSGSAGVLPPALHSRAEVKFALLDRLPAFTRPELPTDLRPSAGRTVPLWSPTYARHMHEWQRSALHRHAPELSSFSIANMSMDCLDGVDVISEGDNIKKLLKLAYNSREEISMMVHRVGRLLLLDEFDITTHLLETEKSEWVWLDRLLREHFMSKFEDADWARRAAAEEEAAAVDTHAAALYSQLLLHSARALPAAAAAPPLALPAPADISETPPHRGRYRRHYFTRNMLWTFQDLKMLIGTDMPILGGGTHPCVSLRLHDLSQPINVLTGLDYWLDNLMSNVPEVLMCYHVDGVLKKYSLMKTEDLPHLPDSSFEPKVVHDVAENILSFLRENATKTGHTYWLFKGEEDDYVKLYDLSSLLEKNFENVSRDDNPFTGPVALLLYRIACNMLRKRHVVDYGDRLGTVRTILNKTLDLIRSDKYLQVRANIHMMLADCYVPRDHRPLATEFTSAAAAQLARSPERGAGPPAAAPTAGAPVTSPWTQQPMVRVDLLARKGAVPAPDGGWEGDLRPQPISGDARQRTEHAMEHVLAALDCLQHRRILERDDKAPKMARPTQAIPMPYCPLNTLLASSPPPVEPPSPSPPPPPPPPSPPPSQEPGCDVTETLLLQKAAHLCTVRAAAAAERSETLATLQMAQAALCCVRASGGSVQVPEVTAAGSILVSDGLLLLSRAPAAERAAARQEWFQQRDPLGSRLVQILIRHNAYDAPSFVERDDDTETAPESAETGDGRDGPFRLLQDAIASMEATGALKLSPEMRQHVRTRHGLILNEVGLLHSRRMETTVRSLQTSAAADEQRRRAVQLRKPVLAAKQAAETAFAKAVSLLDGTPQRCAAEMNLGHLFDRSAMAQHRLWGDVSATLEDLERTAACYERAAAPGKCPRFAEQTAAVVGCSDFAARMLLLRSAVGYRMAQLYDQLPPEPRAPRAAQELLRRALALCDPSRLPTAARQERRQVCFHAAEILAMLAALHTKHAQPPASEKRRRELLREALSSHGQAAGMYQQAGRPDRVLASLQAQAALRERLAVGCSHWYGRVKLVEEALSSAAAADSPLCRLLWPESGAPPCPEEPGLAEQVELEASALFTSLLNALRTVCTLLRKYGTANKKQAPAYFEELYRKSLGVSLRPGTGLQKLSSLVEHIRTAQSPAPTQKAAPTAPKPAPAQKTAAPAQKSAAQKAGAGEGKAAGARRKTSLPSESATSSSQKAASSVAAAAAAPDKPAT